MEFLERVEKLCAQRGISKRTMELDIGLSSGASSKWRKGVPRGDTIDKVAKYFGVTTDFLMGTNEEYRNPGNGIMIPVLGKVVAGVPLEAVRDVICWEEISADLANRGEYFGLQVRGDSMSPRMLEGDIVIVRIQSTAVTGDIVIAQFKDESDNIKSCVKKFVKTEWGILLQSYNPLYEPIVFDNERAKAQEFQIIGKVIELRGKFN